VRKLNNWLVKAAPGALLCYAVRDLRRDYRSEQDDRIAAPAAVRAVMDAARELQEAEKVLLVMRRRADE